MNTFRYLATVMRKLRPEPNTLFAKRQAFRKNAKELIFMKYVYPAVFRRADEPEELWYIDFPDVEGAFTDAKSLYEAIEMAEDVLAGMLVTYEDYKAGRLNTPMNNRIVEPTPIEQVKAEPDEFSTSAFVTLIKADTDAYRKMLAEMNQAKAEPSAPATSGAS